MTMQLIQSLTSIAFSSKKPLRIGIQKSGRLMEDSIKFFQENDIDIAYQKDGAYESKNNIAFYFLREKDIPSLIGRGTLDAGIVGYNTFLEKKTGFLEGKLGFSKCRLSIAVPEKSSIQTVQDLAGKRFATSYPNALKKYLNDNQVKAKTIEKFEGSVETIATMCNMDAIMDIVETGNSLKRTGFRELVTIAQSEAVLLANKRLDQQLNPVQEIPKKMPVYFDRYEHIYG